jgi:hypothetical protein
MAAIRKPILVAIAALFAFPLALIAFGIADHASTPQIIRCIISPGYVATMEGDLGPGGWRSLGSAVFIALSLNFIYYEFLSYWPVALLIRKLSNYSGLSHHRNAAFGDQRTRKP